MDPFLLLRNLGKRGEVLGVATDPGAIPALDAIDPTRCYLSWVVTIRTAETPDALEGVFQFVADVCAVEVSEDVGPAVADTTGCEFSRLTTANALLSEYEAAYAQLLGWVERRLPGLQSLTTRPA
jgi:two-component system chemotaxis sensor kinase CheA